MAYFKTGLLLIAAMVFLVSGCSVMPGKKSAGKEPAASDSIEAALQNGEPIELIANPYLSSSKKAATGAKEQFLAALTSMQSEDWRSAQTQLTAMTVAFPELSGPFVNLGICHWRQDNVEEAKNTFEKAITVNSLNGDAYLNYALLQREQGKFTEAEALYLKAIAIWPHNESAHLNLGILYDMYMGRFDDALNHFEMVQKLKGEPDRRIAGWIIDIKRRNAKK